MAMLRGYYRNEHGRVAWRWFDGVDQFPPAHYDAPDKVPGAVDGPMGPVEGPRLSTVTGEVYGERRRGGWPKGVSRKDMAGRP